MPDDAPACVTILRDWIDATEWMPMLHSLDSMEGFWRDRFSEDYGWVALREGVIVGFCLRNANHISALYLREDARNQGVGQALLDLAKAGCDSLSLWAFVANGRAIAFYQRQGFSEIYRSDGDNEEGLPDVKLLWVKP